MPPTTEQAVDGAFPKPAAAWYAVAILLVMFMLSFTDRQIVSLMVEPLQKDLGLSDTQIGLLQGFGFVVLNVFAGLLLGWASDRFSRRILIFLGVLVWSLSCAASGLSRAFSGLLTARIGVGVGEATLTPAGYSMMADLFPREKLSLAMSAFTIGSNLGVALSFTLGGAVVSLISAHGAAALPLIGSLHAWQITFIVVGLPGVFLSFLMLTVREPARRGKLSEGAPFLRPLLAFFRPRGRLIFCHFAAFSLNSLLGFAQLGWAPALLGRRFGMDPAHIGPAIGLIVGGFGIAGGLASGLLTGSLFRRGVEDAHFRVQAVLFAAIVPCAVIEWLATSPAVFLAGFAGAYFFSAATVPNAGIILQLVTPNELRGRVASAYTFCASVFGAGLGPLAVGLITQYVLRDRHALGASIGIVVGTAAALGTVLMLYGRPAHLRAVRLLQSLLQNRGAAAS